MGVYLETILSFWIWVSATRKSEMYIRSEMFSLSACLSFYHLSSAYLDTYLLIWNLFKMKSSLESQMVSLAQFSFFVPKVHQSLFSCRLSIVSKSPLHDIILQNVIWYKTQTRWSLSSSYTLTFSAWIK